MPWASSPIQSNGQVKSLFYLAMSTEVGDDNSTLFWRDRWLMGRRLMDLAPHVFALVPKRFASKRTVAECIADMSWVQDISEVALLPDIPDRHFWRFSSSGCYFAKSVYDVLLYGATGFEHWKRIWKSWTPPKCCYFPVVSSPQPLLNSGPTG
jgi:hypothetical protein